MIEYSYAAAGELTVSDVVDLYSSVGWTAYTDDPQTLLQALSGSSTVAVAREEGRLIGLARVISDGHTICYLQDILVHPRFQRSGIGGALVSAALRPYPAVRQKVLLTDDESGQKAFYEALGFTQSTAFPAGPMNAFVRFD